jgi:hypothetical protein
MRRQEQLSIAKIEPSASICTSANTTHGSGGQGGHAGLPPLLKSSRLGGSA